MGESNNILFAVQLQTVIDLLENQENEPEGFLLVSEERNTSRSTPELHLLEYFVPGDLITIPVQAAPLKPFHFKHYGVYLGKIRTSQQMTEPAHFVLEYDKIDGNFQLQLTPLVDFLLADRQCRLMKRVATRSSGTSVLDILRRAQAVVESYNPGPTGQKYSLFSRNCETFARDVTGGFSTSKPISQQSCVRKNFLSWLAPRDIGSGWKFDKGGVRCGEGKHHARFCSCGGLDPKKNTPQTCCEACFAKYSRWDKFSCSRISRPGVLTTYSLLEATVEKQSASK